MAKTTAASSDTTTGLTPLMDRALPGWAIDLIRDGVTTAALNAKGDGAVWSALIRTAASAQHHGQDRMEWEYVILEPMSHLGTQVRLKDRYRARSAMALAKLLIDAWETAWVWRSQQPPAWNAQEVAQVAQERAKAIIDLVADPNADLTDSQRAVLSYAARETQQRGMLRVALPREQLLAATSLGLTALRTALKGLETKGLLTLAEAGKPRGPKAKKARANLYALPDPSMSWVPQPVVPPNQTCSAPTNSIPGAPLHTYGAPKQEATPGRSTDTPSAGTTMVNFTLYPDGRVVMEAEDPHVALLALERGTAKVHITKTTQNELP